MKRLLLAGLVAAFSFVWPCEAWSCDTLTNATDNSQCVVMPFQVKRGIWFELQLAEKLGHDSDLLPVVQKESVIKDEMIVAQESKISLLEAAIENRKKESEKLNQQLAEDSVNMAKLSKQYDDAIQSKDSIIRSPVLWYGIGFVTGIVITVTGIELAKKAGL